MENQHVLSGLIRKRAEVAGELEAAQNRVRQLIIDIDNVDATIRLFQPDIDLAEIRPKPLPPRHAAFKGEISRLIMNVLRETGLALTTKDITLRVMADRGLNVSDPRLARTVQKRVGAALRHLRTRGTVRSEARKGSNLGKLCIAQCRALPGPECHTKSFVLTNPPPGNVTPASPRGREATSDSPSSLYEKPEGRFLSVIDPE